MEERDSLATMNIIAQVETSPVLNAIGGFFGFIVFVIAALIFVTGLVLPLVVWQMNNRVGRIEERTIAMRRMMRLIEEHLRAIRVTHTGEQLEPRDPAL